MTLNELQEGFELGQIEKSENNFILYDRLVKIRDTITKYGSQNFYIAFSCGKDSTVLSALIDMALPDNEIPRVYANTGLEYKMIREFVQDLAKSDLRIRILKPTVKITKMLREEGFPFKSKPHAKYVAKYQKKGFEYKSVRAYTKMENTLSGRPILRACPKKLMYQFTPENTLKISDMCCVRLKEDPMKLYSIESLRPYAITGVMRSEGGRRQKSTCLAFNGKKLKFFQPMAPLTKEWEDWFIDAYDIKICDIYKPPYNRERTGCKGCPFALHLQEELDMMEEFFPNERKQCEIIWKPVYDEYRRLGYRLKDEVNHDEI
jgi:3'-phosphoadenosine 5'-phosphosulfate sulfotransferase (PAPS reductase)/FAD synthetase